jgi:hypothetical protein
LARLPLVELIFDQKRIGEGDAIHPGISDMIDSAELVVAIITVNSLASREARTNWLVLTIAKNALHPLWRRKP